MCFFRRIESVTLHKYNCIASKHSVQTIIKVSLRIVVNHMLLRGAIKLLVHTYICNNTHAVYITQN